jgi:zinc/manganese transport system ATP-binding protein/zinc transport system ATP-binding protein
MGPERPGPDGRVALEFAGVTCAYGRRTVFADVNLGVPVGAFAAIVGPTGCGKTTLLRAALGLLEPVAGAVRVFGEPPWRQRGRVGYVPQLELVDWSFPLTVRDVVLMGCYRDMGRWPWPGRRERRAVEELLARLHIADCEAAPLRELSGGQQQRVFLARALIARPPLLVLDEPTAGVDLSTQREILEILRDLNDEGTTIVLTTHDLNAVAARLPWVVCFNRGVVAAGAPAKVLTADVLSVTYQAEIVVVETEAGRFMAPAPPAVTPGPRKRTAHGHPH